MIIVTTCHDLSGCGSLTCCTSSQAGLHTWPEPSAQVASRQVACLKNRAFRTWACDACTASISLRVHPPVLLEASETSLGRSESSSIAYSGKDTCSRHMQASKTRAGIGGCMRLLSILPALIAQLRVQGLHVCLPGPEGSVREVLTLIHQQPHGGS